MTFPRRRLEDDDDFRIERGDMKRFEVAASLKCDPIDRRNERRTFRVQRAQPAIVIGLAAANRCPFSVATMLLEDDGDAGRGAAAGGVKDVYRDGAHVRFVTADLVVKSHNMLEGSSPEL